MAGILLMVYTKVYYRTDGRASNHRQHGPVGDAAGLSVLMQNPHLFMKHFAEVLR
jgi:hypothetical protein